MQVNAELKVGELIRRIRTQTDLAPSASDNPRVAVKGQEIGHGMSLGECGVDKEATVMFSHDDVR